MKKILIILTIGLALWACSSDSPNEEVVPSPVAASFERSDMLANWADNIIVPSYVAFTASLENLSASFNAFKLDASTTNFNALKISWLSSYTLWQRVSMFEIGPAETVGFRLNMNIYPTDTDKIDSFVTTGAYDLTLSSNRDAKGFPALDYLINGLAETDEAIVEKFNASDREGLIAYFDAVLADMTALSNEVLSSWQAEFRDIFVENDGSSSTASVDRFVNDYIFYYEKFLRAGKMGIPLGVFSGTQLPEKVEAFYEGDVSNVLFLEALQASQDFFNGKYFGASTTGESLASYLDALRSADGGEDLSKIINDQFDLAKSMVGGLASFKTEIETNNPAENMFLAYDEVQRVVPMLKVDMVSAMSIRIDFVDADGD